MDSFGKVVLQPFGHTILLILTRTLSGVFADPYQDPDLHFHLRVTGGMQGAPAQAGAGAGVSPILALRRYPTETSTETKGRL
ncbi:hypothetical protein T459_34115 [Capsicum annuum]|uniref:Uncharacterized protein n=1 Tax=Capsicum annuum TaxID=4072 RepID=A0A2G2XX02_CAPAN|nr:hypothetical protein T459_34115 [Capsicum annuum]